MPDDLTSGFAPDGTLTTNFVANVSRGHPWHRLGVQVRADMTIDEALAYAGCDDHVTHETLYCYDPQEGYVPLKRWDAIRSDKFGVMNVASPKYEITQRRRMVELAYEIVGLSPDSAHIDTLGCIGDNAEVFFAYLRVPDLVIDPQGIADIIERGLFTATSFDYSLRNALGYSLIRTVCKNTLKAGFATAKQLIEVRHTKNSEELLMEAGVAAGYLGAVEKEVTEKAEAMLRVDGRKAIQALKDHFWPVDPDLQLGEKALTRRHHHRARAETLYCGPGNVSASVAGENGWAAYQAIVEWHDFERDGVKGTAGKPRAVLETKLAESAVLPGAVVNAKIKAADIVLALGA